MEEDLRKIRVWASHGTMRQFAAEVAARLSGLSGYKSELDGDTLTVFRIQKIGGFLGIGARKERQPVLRIIKEGSSVAIPEDSIDPEFISQFGEVLKQH